MEQSTPTCSKRLQNSLSTSSEPIQSTQLATLEHWKSNTKGTTSISFLCICRSRISRKVGVQVTSVVASSLITNHSQSVSGGWRLAGTEGNLSPLLYHGSIVGRPNISPRGFGDPKPELELSPLSLEPLDTAALPATEGLPSPEKVLSHPLVDLLEEEAIYSEQAKEEEEKEKEKEEERVGSCLYRMNSLPLRKTSNG